MSYPYRADAAEWLADGPVRHIATVELGSIAVPVESGHVRFSGTTIPTCTADLAIPVIAATEELFDLLDPRRAAALTVSAGYIYPDGQTDVHQLARLYPTAVELNPADGTLRLTASSAEVALDSSTVLWVADITGLPRTGVPEAVGWILSRVAPGSSFRSAVPTGAAAWVMAETEVQEGDLWAGILEEITQAAGYRLSVDRTGTWVLDYRADTVNLEQSTLLADGPRGTLLDVARQASLDEWANVVRLWAEWTTSTGEQRRQGATATVTAGPMGTATVGRKVHTRRFTRPVTAGVLTARARTILARLYRLGSGLKIDAVAHYWIDPGDTVSIQVDEQRTAHIVRNITYDLAAGTMSLSTRDDIVPVIEDLTEQEN